MSRTYAQQIAEVAAISPNADLEELRRWAMYVQAWMRTREPVSSGEALQKFATRQELLNAGLVSYSAGVQNASAEPITVNPTLITPTAASLTLSADRYYFDFDDAVDTTPTGGTITLTSSLGGATGYVTFTAVGYDEDHLPLGPIPLTVLTASTAQLTGSNFINGLGADVRYVKVVATQGGLSGYVYIYRREAGIGALIMDISRRYQVVTTAQDNSNPDLSAIYVDVLLYRGQTNETTLWDWTLTDTNCTSLLNNDTIFPVPGSATMKVAVVDMSASAAQVEIKATRTANPDQTVIFEISKIGFAP